MIWIVGGIIVYLAIGAYVVAFIVGSSKTSRGWSARQAWDQLTNEGWSGSILWFGIMFGWFPLAAFFICRFLIWTAMGKPR